LNGIINQYSNKLLKNTKFWNFLFQNFFISKKTYIFAVSKNKNMNIPVYKLEKIMKAIRKEGLADNAYGFKTPSIVYVYVDAMEKNEIWDNLPTPLAGFELAHWDVSQIEAVKYFIIDGYDYIGNLENILECLKK
jgi:hypothetical protein